jgi:hypothetical protein
LHLIRGLGKTNASASLNKLGGVWHLDIETRASQIRASDAYAAEEKAAAEAQKARKKTAKANLNAF